MNKTISITIFGALILLAHGAEAAGFRLMETGNVGQGRAHAMVAGVNDASAVFYNPAAMTEAGKYSATAGFQFVDPKAYHTGDKNGADNIETANESFAVPHIYSVKNLADSSLAIGFGLFSNFGNGTNWSIESPLRYEATDTKMRTSTLNVSGAMSLGVLSIGAGLNYMSAHVEYDNTVPYHGFGADGYSIMEGDGSGFGVNVGVLFKATDAIKIGASYRSAITTTISGDLTLENMPDPLYAMTHRTTLATDAGGHGGTSTYNNYHSGGEVEVAFPAMASVGIALQVSEDLGIEVDADYTMWSSFDQLSFKFDKPLSVGGTTILPSEVVKAQNWKDTVAIKAGLSLRYSKSTTLRAGAYIDPSPVPDDTFTPRIPDSDRTVVTAGFSYQAVDKFVVDGAMGYVMSAARNVNNDVGQPHTDIDGEYKGGAMIFGLSVGYQFK